MTDAIDSLRTTLKRHGQSLTAGRRAVFGVLQHAEPQTMHDIIAACAGKADRASVYRTISLFEQLGIVQRLQMGWKYRIELTDAFSHHHHHLTCTVCGTVTPLPEDDALESQLRRLADSNGFTAESHQLEIRGRCRSCGRAGDTADM